MVQFNFSERTIKAKVVYYGPAQSGKTTNLEQIHRITDPAGSNRLISLNTAQDRTLFFDLLPFSLGAVSGYDFKVQLYTVPGQVQYNATRRVVLAGADAVVFVADSRKAMAKENLAAFENMKVNLLANRLVPEKVPLVFQHNKRDLSDLLAVDEMNRTLNGWGRPFFAAVASEAKGVIETFVAVVQQMLQAIAAKYNLKEKGLDPATIPEVVAEAFAAVLKGAESAGPLSHPARVTVSAATDPERHAPPQPVPDAGLVSEELLHRAIRSNVDLAEVLSGLVHEMNIGLGTILSHAELLAVYGEDAPEKRKASIQLIQREASRLRGVMDKLGGAGARASAGGASAAVPTPAVSAPPPVEPVRPATPAAAGLGVARPTAGLESTLNAAVSMARPALEAHGLSVEVRVTAGASPPRCPPEHIGRAVVAALKGIANSVAPGSAAVLRCEKKPVLLRARDGGEVRRDFLMLALAHGGGLLPEEQERIVQGSDPGPLGQASRLVREMGGFVRFAPLPGGGLETRLFLPAA